MSLPEGSFVLIGVWLFVVFLLWNLYHFSRAFRKSTGMALIALAAVGLIGGVVYLHFRQQALLPTDRLGIVIFPLIEKSECVSCQVNPSGLAIADIAAEHLRQTANSPFYVIPPDAVFALAAHDSLQDLNYVLRFAQRAKLAVIGWGTFAASASALTNGHQSWRGDFKLFDLREAKNLSSSSGQSLKLPSKFTRLQKIGSEMARAILRQWPARDETATAAVWQEQLETEPLERYYAIKLALATRHLETSRSPAFALFHSDTTRAAFANLYAQTLLAQLRRAKAPHKIWEDSLRAILPFIKRNAANDSLHRGSARLLGEIYIHLKKWNEAERALIAARRRDATDSRVYTLFAQLHASRWQARGFQNELELYQQARWLNPLDLDAQLAAAEFLFQANRRNEALALLERLRHANPNQLEVLMSLGRIYLAQNTTAKIFEIYQRILAVEPNHAEAYYNLGILHYHDRDWDNARKFFERAISANNHAEARLYLANIYEQQGQLDKTIATLRERIRLSHGDDDKYAAEARRRLYAILLARGEIPAHLRPDRVKTP